MKILLSVLFIVLFLCMLGQSDSIKTKFFSNIYPAFTLNLNNSKKIIPSFEMNTALLGIRSEINNKATIILIYDVSKTTSDIQVFDTSNQSLTVNYFKGSDYTAFLKQAEAKWTPNKSLEFSIGQLLNEQYLTVQDKFWGYRYVMFTFQERYKFGYPADFGIRAAFKTDKIRISTTLSNGEGPFNKQDINGWIQYALNIEYRPSEHFILKAYGDVYPNEHTHRSAFSGFIGIEYPKFKAALEQSIVLNDKWDNKKDYEGYSGFVSRKINPKLNFFLRNDYLVKSIVYENTNVSLIGFDYLLNTNLIISFNYRYFLSNNYKEHQLAFSVGAKF